MSLTLFRKNLFKSFDLMRGGSATLVVYHRRKVYKLHIEQTGERFTRPYKTKRKANLVPAALIDTTPCKQCESLLIAGICANKQCESNTNKTPNEV